jgi:peptidoglycan hydrolase-like protein with peptidoglycan-binding domain
MSPEEIRRIQIILRDRGYTVEIDGVWGPQTRQAIVAFQRQQGFQATGEIDERTSVALGMNRSPGGQEQQGATPRGDQPTTGQGREGNPPARGEPSSNSPARGEPFSDPARAPAR